jgi:hypothetical protein
LIFSYYAFTIEHGLTDSKANNMAQFADQIAAVEEELAQLKADEAAENAALAASRPAGIPTTWKPITFRRGPADWVVIGWADSDYRVMVSRVNAVAVGALQGPSIPL